MMLDVRRAKEPLRRFIVRIELPTHPAADYDQLYECMRSAGYARVIRGMSGRVWHLPDGVYTIVSRLPILRIREAVVRLAKQAHPRPRVFVEAGGSSAWSGLRLVTPDDPDPDDRE